MKIPFFLFFFFFFFFFFFLGGGGRVEGGRGQGGCELRREAFVKIQKKKKKFCRGVGLGGGQVRGRGVKVDVNGEVKLL